MMKRDEKLRNTHRDG